MDEEIECIDKNQTWKLVDVLKDRDVISVKWIYKTKQDVDGNVQKNTRKEWSQENSHSNPFYISMKPSHQLHAWTQS